MVDSHVADVGGLQTPLDIHRDGEGLLVMPTDGDGVVLQTIRFGQYQHKCLLFVNIFQEGQIIIGPPHCGRYFVPYSSSLIWVSNP